VWSPKANADGRRNVTYDNLAKCQGGDVVFSYANGKISQIGLVEQAAVTAPKPPEFGTTGDYWGAEGWLVLVNWQPLSSPLVPQTFFELLQPLLPERHSPISTTTGRGNQGVYLAGLSDELGHFLLKLIEDHADRAVQVHLVVLGEEGTAAAALLDDVTELQAVPNVTEREALTKARLGQGLFRQRVAQLEPCCRVTGLARQEFLVASHIKPWKSSTNDERLSGLNGLFLSPHVDKLFDSGFLSFEDSGALLISPKLDEEVLPRWHIDPNVRVRKFGPDQAHFLEHHRQFVFRAA